MQNNVEIPRQAPAFTSHPQSVRSCLATGTEVNRSAKMVASQKAEEPNLSVRNDDSALKDPERGKQKHKEAANCRGSFTLNAAKDCSGFSEQMKNEWRRFSFFFFFLNQTLKTCFLAGAQASRWRLFQICPACIYENSLRVLNILTNPKFLEHDTIIQKWSETIASQLTRKSQVLAIKSQVKSKSCTSQYVYVILNVST